MRVLFLTYFICFLANGTSCVIPEKQFDKWNVKYGSLIKVEVSNNLNEYFVLATLPREIEGLKLNYVLLHQGQPNPTFSAQLATFEEDGELKTAYTTNNIRIKDNMLTVGFGRDCGIDVSVAVALKSKYNK